MKEVKYIKPNAKKNTIRDNTLFLIIILEIFNINSTETAVIDFLNVI